jgi:hypothetical protein
MMIEENFRKLFLELEEGHIVIRQRLNSFSKRDNDFGKRLDNEVNEFEAWRFLIMDAIYPRLKIL